MNTGTFLEQLGFEQQDIELLNSDQKIEDFTPFLDKINSTFADKIKQDETFVEQLAKPYKEQLIGKENQIKRALRKAFALDIKEDDLKKIDFNKLLEQGLQHIKSNENSDDLKTRLVEEMEGKEAMIEQLKSEYEAKIEALNNKFEYEKRQGEIDKNILSELEAEPLVEKQNLNFMLRTMKGLLSQDGYKLDITAQKKIVILDENGIPAKDIDGKSLTFNKYLKNNLVQLKGNIFSKGEHIKVQTQIQNNTNKSRFLIS